MTQLHKILYRRTNLQNTLKILICGDSKGILRLLFKYKIHCWAPILTIFTHSNRGKIVRSLFDISYLIENCIITSL